MYALTTSGGILRLADNAFIPADITNSDYTMYLQWLNESTVVDPAAPIAEVVSVDAELLNAAFPANVDLMEPETATIDITAE